MIAEALAGKRIFVTGSTGFLGTALAERLLRSVPGCELVLLVRPGKRSTPEQRVLMTTLAEAEAAARDAAIEAPTIIAIGEIVSLRTELDWWSAGV